MECKMNEAVAAEHHVVVFPWPEQGHINPAVSAAHFLAASGIHVTFVHTERTYSRMQEGREVEVGGGHGNFRVEVVPDDSVLSDHAATQAGLDSLLTKLMQSHPRPSCLLVDSFYPWANRVAARHGLARVEHWIACANAFSIGVHVPDLIAKGYLPITDPDCREKVVDFIPGLTPFRMTDIPSVLATSNLEDPIFKFFVSVVEHSREADRVLAHTIYEVEGSTIDALKESAGIRMDPIGPLLTTDRHGLLVEDPECMSWLDKQEKGSVVYIAFGSVSVLKEEVLVELAYGLVASEQPFLWVIRPTKDSNASEYQIEGKLHEALNVVKQHGKGFVTSWAPQIAVLGHTAVGAFLSHCGWNSAMESLYVGVPIIGFPQGGDQPVNYKYIVNDWKVGLALLQEGEKKGELLHRDRVEKVVRAMMMGEEGRQAKEAALKWSKVAHKALLGSSNNNLQRFVDDIKQGNLKISTLAS